MKYLKVLLIPWDPLNKKIWGGRNDLRDSRLGFNSRADELVVQDKVEERTADPHFAVIFDEA